MEDITMSPSVVVLACCGSPGLVSLVPSCTVSTVVGGQMMGKPGFAESPLSSVFFFSPHCECIRFADEKHGDQRRTISFFLFKRSQEELSVESQGPHTPQCQH